MRLGRFFLRNSQTLTKKLIKIRIILNNSLWIKLIIKNCCPLMLGNEFIFLIVSLLILLLVYSLGLLAKGA